MRTRLTERISKQSASGLRREIAEGFKYDKKKLKHLKRILHNVTVALGTLSSALHEFSRIKGPDISPDGMLGGLGYIMPLKEVKEVLNTGIKNLSDVADSIADEMTNPNWDAGDDKEVKKLLKEKEETEELVEEAEEVTDEVPEEEPEQDDDVVNPKEVMTSSDLEKRVASYFSEAVQQNLVRFNSIGKNS
jgi:hypothetical protein